MKRLMTVLVALLALALLAPAASAQAAGTATVYVVHGIPGPGKFPVDISVNGSCALRGFTFRSVTNGINLPAGNVTLAISPANTAQPCGNAPVLGPTTVSLAAGQRVSIVAYLTAAGTPTVGLFPFNRTRSSNSARVVVHHTAAAPAVNVRFNRSGGTQSFALQNVSNGNAGSRDVQAGGWRVAIAPASGGPGVFAANLNLSPNTTYLVFAVGSLSDGTFTVLVKPV